MRLSDLTPKKGNGNTIHSIVTATKNTIPQPVRSEGKPATPTEPKTEPVKTTEPTTTQSEGKPNLSEEVDPVTDNYMKFNIASEAKPVLQGIATNLATTALSAFEKTPAGKTIKGSVIQYYIKEYWYAVVGAIMIVTYALYAFITRNKKSYKKK